MRLMKQTSAPRRTVGGPVPAVGQRGPRMESTGAGRHPADGHEHPAGVPRPGDHAGGRLRRGQRHRPVVRALPRPRRTPRAAPRPRRRRPRRPTTRCRPCSPAQAGTFDAALAADLVGIPPGRARQGIAVGHEVARQILAWRSTDGSGAAVPYTPGTDPGDWQPTPPAFLPALAPQWPDVTPFAMTGGSQFRPAAPPALDSAEYAAAFNEVKDLGRADSTTRTADQTQIALFWRRRRRHLLRLRPLEQDRPGGGRGAGARPGRPTPACSPC